jgi:putative ABC transport system substrate-binding protein
MFRMKRREFIGLLGGAAAGPLAARAQQGERKRRFGVLIGFDESDLEGEHRLAAFRQGLQALRWTEGSNLHIEYGRYTGDTDRVRGAAAELIGLSPEVILAYAPLAVASLRRETRSIPTSSPRSAIRSAPGSSQAWGAQVVILPVSLASN